jgi:periplasmic protein CpxP/Spy
MASNRKLGGRVFKTAMAAVLVAGLGMAARAYAQQHPGGPMGGPHGDPAAHFAEMCDTMEARQAGMLAFAEVRLGITDAERPAWTKFASSVKASSAAMKQLCTSAAAQPRPKTLPDHLHRMEAMETAHLEQLRQITPAVEELYGTLNPKQRELADQMVEHMMHRGPGPGPGGMQHPPLPGHDGTPGKAPN